MSRPNTPPVAFFDFDGTLTTGDTLMPFLRFAVGRRAYYAKLMLLSPVLGAYFANLLRNDITKAIVVKQYLGGLALDELYLQGERFSREVLPTMLRPQGMARLAWHKDQGHVCVLVSASLDLYLGAWARLHGLDDILCTRMACEEKVINGMVFGTNCYGNQKVAEIRKYLSGLNPGKTYAYGDNPADRFMLEYVDQGYMLHGQEFKRLTKG